MKDRLVVILLFLVLAGTVFLFPGTATETAASSGDVVVICNPGVPTDSLSKAFLRDIYTGKQKVWSDGKKIVFVVLKRSKAHKRFLKQYVRKTESQFQNYWVNMVFSGKGQAPQKFSSEEKLVQYVKNTEGAIGYISSSTNRGGAKVVAVQ